MGEKVSQITSLTIVYSPVYSEQINENIKAPRHCGEFTGDRMYSPHKWPVTRKMFSFDDVFMHCGLWICFSVKPAQMKYDTVYSTYRTSIFLVHNDVIIFRVTGCLWGESTGHKIQWHGALMFSLICAWTFEQTIETPVIWYSIALIMTSLWC